MAALDWDYTFGAKSPYKTTDPDGIIAYGRKLKVEQERARLEKGYLIDGIIPFSD